MRRLLWAGIGTVLALVVVTGSWALLSAAAGSRPTVLEAPGDYGIVPDFELTDRSGRTVRTADLKGQYWIADFIFTRCTGVCPILTARMASLGASLDGVRLVSFSVDPVWDTTEVLSRYAAGVPGGADTQRWLFLTGPREDLYRLISEGFKLNVAERPADAAAGDLITHSDRLVLVDPEGRIRGYYHGSDDDSARRLAHDLERLR